jgi:hypothetical protein
LTTQLEPEHHWPGLCGVLLFGLSEHERRHSTLGQRPRNKHAEMQRTVTTSALSQARTNTVSDTNQPSHIQLEMRCLEDRPQAPVIILL